MEECCGQEDCDKKACGGYTSVTLNDGSTQVCCGKKDCEEKFKASLPINLVGLPFDLYTGCIGDGGVFHPHITIYGNPHKKMFINKLNTEEVMNNPINSSYLPVLQEISSESFLFFGEDKTNTINFTYFDNTFVVDGIYSHLRLISKNGEEKQSADVVRLES